MPVIPIALLKLVKFIIKLNGYNNSGRESLKPLHLRLLLRLFPLSNSSMKYVIINLVANNFSVCLMKECSGYVLFQKHLNQQIEQLSSKLLEIEKKVS